MGRFRRVEYVCSTGQNVVIQIITITTIIIIIIGIEEEKEEEKDERLLVDMHIVLTGWPHIHIKDNEVRSE